MYNINYNNYNNSLQIQELNTNLNNNNSSLLNKKKYSKKCFYPLT